MVSKQVIQENRLPQHLDGAKVKISTARNCAFALIGITLPNVKHTITTNKHQTTISERIIALHGIDGSCSNQAYFGAIDMFCTNGQIGGEYDAIKRKNTRVVSDVLYYSMKYVRQRVTLINVLNLCKSGRTYL